MRRIANYAAVLLIALVTQLKTSAVEFDIWATSHPNAFGSPHFDQSVQMGFLAIQDNWSQSTYGIGPSAYSKISSPISVSDNIVTGFPSWKGNADPGTTYGSEYQNELGNRVHFDGIIRGAGEKIDIFNLGFSMTSTDTGNSLDFSFGPGSYTYNNRRMGVLYGSDGVLGGGDDTYLTTGTGLVDEIWLAAGSGNAWAVYDTDTGDTRQDKINNAIAALGTDFNFTGTYTLGNSSGSATVQFRSNNGTSVPDGGATAGMLLGSIGVLGFLKRKK